MFVKLLGTFLRVFGEVVAICSILAFNLLLAIPPFAEPTYSRAPLFALFYFGGYTAHIGLAFLEFSEGRWSVDVWIGSWILLVGVAASAGIPLLTLMLPYAHAAVWWAGCLGVRRLLRRYWSVT